MNEIYNYYLKVPAGVHSIDLTAERSAHIIAAQKCQYHVERTTNRSSYKNTSTSEDVMRLQLVFHQARIFSSHATEVMTGDVFWKLVKFPKGVGSERDKSDENTTLSAHKQTIVDFISCNDMPDCDNYDDDVINDTDSVTQPYGHDEYVPDNTDMNNNEDLTPETDMEDVIALNVCNLSQLGNLKRIPFNNKALTDIQTNNLDSLRLSISKSRANAAKEFDKNIQMVMDAVHHYKTLMTRRRRVLDSFIARDSVVDNIPLSDFQIDYDITMRTLESTYNV